MNKAHLSPIAVSLSEFLSLDFGKEEAQKMCETTQEEVLVA